MPVIPSIGAGPGVESHRFAMLVRVYAETLIMVAASTGLGLLMAPRLGTSPVDLLYLLPVLVAASLYGLRPALFAAAASVLAYNYFFTEPVHTFRIHNAGDIVTVLMLLAVAVVTSQLASRMRMQARLAAANAARNATIAGFARRLIVSATPDEIARITCQELSTVFQCNAAILVARGEAGAEVLAIQPEGGALTPGDIATAAWVLEHGEVAGRGSPRLNPAEWLFYPVRTEARTLAALGLARDDGRPPVPEDHLPLLTSQIDQTALALERAALEDSMRDVAQLRERDRLRGALLSSVGHDLRTPLTAITAAAAELRRRTREHQDELVTTLESESAKLDRYIANLLDMARIEAGAIRLRSEPIDLVDAVAAAERDLRHRLAGHDLKVDLPPDLPLVRADPELLHHCLINILDNAARHSEPGSPIRVSAARQGEDVVLEIEDEGPGLSMTGDTFETFARISGSDRKGGTGLGLAIVKGFADAMGLVVEARNRIGASGAIFSLHFPRRLVLNEPVEAEIDQSL